MAATVYSNHYLGSKEYSYWGPPLIQLPLVAEPAAADVQLIRQIGFGSYGVVWSVVDPRNGKKAALKKLVNAFDDYVAIKRALRELKLLCFCRHDNILGAIEVLKTPLLIGPFRHVFVLTDLMQCDLHNVIIRNPRIADEYVKLFTYQILRGLKYLHSAHILHRDLKPGNILVNNNLQIKICDFGFARKQEFDESCEMTAEVVTQYYRAPEILTGSPHYTSKLDIWSVGCIMAEMISGKVLFEASGPVKQLDMITDYLGTPSLSEFGGACQAAVQYVLSSKKSPKLRNLMYLVSTDLSEEAFNFLVKLLKFDPKKRISAAEAMYDPYLQGGRLTYHTYICSCCKPGKPLSSCDTEPSCYKVFEDVHPQISLAAAKHELYTLIKNNSRAIRGQSLTISTTGLQIMNCTAVLNGKKLSPTSKFASEHDQ
ncbi:Serine/threonine-protein kinase NLK2 [Trichoplax sp. H2]|uniref:Protein kinase domain-containing protein n=1 Tax=Trichoplax adhaerens TaxID=10228 RepID=B3S4A6_TRIAD|nr:expressed hypothetical protein [Trichoplax adhaerens]EDV22426.1 expressed hypothetical protein [Trichoplax adhaerens]RDD40979.1 Serine/threonine-protein kinase NLK2 [Trichoplax sp. H2]|eukprot:XP_002114970.1 expressed hypothetical protein [Trichoplax adhaerens]